MMETNDHTDDEDESQNQSAPQLSAIELRVLGALMEKQLTTPDTYPLSVNSIITACNQKSSRDPISHYEAGDVKRTLQQLEDRNFARREYGSRAEKYSQRFIKYLELGKKQQALLCVMMLRGPQTISELDTKTQRMCEFTDRGDLEHSIDRLCSRDVPFAVRLGQQPGQRGERIAHLFCGAPAASAQQERATPAVTSTTAPYARETSSSSHTDHNETVELLTMEVSDLQKKVRDLDAETHRLKTQLTELYSLTGHEAPEVDQG